MKLFHGLSAFPLTPADARGRVDTDAHARLLERLCAAGVDSIGLLGSTGIYAYLTREERRRTIAAAVACVAGRCVAGFACDTTRVTCKIATPSCPAGEVPTVNDAGTCYLGTCAPATECTTVTSCGVCTGASEACVSYETQLGPQHHCVTIPPACNGNGGCSCNGLVSCVAPYRMCTDYSGIRGVTCSCPTC